MTLNLLSLVILSINFYKVSKTFGPCMMQWISHQIISDKLMLFYFTEIVFFYANGTFCGSWGSGIFLIFPFNESPQWATYRWSFQSKIFSLAYQQLFILYFIVHQAFSPCDTSGKQAVEFSTRNLLQSCWSTRNVVSMLLVSMQVC